MSYRVVMDQVTWWALFVTLALISGLMSGLVWRILIANRGIGLGRILTFVVLVLGGGTAALLVGGAIVSELFAVNDSVIVPFLLPPAFAIAWLVGFRLVVRYRSTARIQQRRIVGAAGSHAVTPHVQHTVAPAAPLRVAPPTGAQPLPTPMLVGNREVQEPPATMLAGIEDLTLPPPPPPTS